MIKFLEGIFILAKILLTIILAFFVLMTGYLLFTNPRFNEELQKTNEYQKKLDQESETRQVEIRNEKFKQWKYNYFDEVAIKEEKYPIVVLRTGFKVLRFDEDAALVGWAYELVNTSPNQYYTVNVEYSLTDNEDFMIATGNGETIVQPEDYTIVRGTINVNNKDLSRLYNSTWSISLSPVWTIYEDKTKGDRYSRLESIVKKIPISWMSEEVEIKRAMAIFSPKWAAIGRALEKEWAAITPLEDQQKKEEGHWVDITPPDDQDKKGESNTQDHTQGGSNENFGTDEKGRGNSQIDVPPPRK